MTLKEEIIITFNDFVNTLKILSQGLGTTVSLFFITILLSLPLGFVTTLLSQTKITPIRWIARFYVFIMRGTPLMLQLLVSRLSSTTRHISARFSAAA